MKYRCLCVIVSNPCWVMAYPKTHDSHLAFLSFCFYYWCFIIIKKNNVLLLWLLLAFYYLPIIIINFVYRLMSWVQCWWDGDNRLFVFSHAEQKMENNANNQNHHDVWVCVRVSYNYIQIAYSQSPCVNTIRYQIHESRLMFFFSFLYIDLCKIPKYIFVALLKNNNNNNKKLLQWGRGSSQQRS